MNFLIVCTLATLSLIANSLTEIEALKRLEVDADGFAFRSVWNGSSFELSVRMNTLQTLLSFWLEDKTSNTSYLKIYSISDIGGSLTADMAIDDLFRIFLPPQSRRNYPFDQEIQSAMPGYYFIVRKTGTIEAVMNKVVFGRRKTIKQVLRLDRVKNEQDSSDNGDIPQLV